LGCDSTEPCADIVLDLGDGRYHDTEYDTDTGYYFYDRLRYIGSFYDALSAMSVLTDPTTYFIGVDSSQPVHNYILSMYFYFGPELNKLFGAMAAGRSDVVGPVLGKNGQLQRRAWFGKDAIAAQVGQPTLELPGVFILRNYALAFGMAWLNANWDQTFNDSLQVWLEGSGEAFSPPADATVTTFENPSNYRVYHAVKMPEPLYSPGYVMLQDASQLALQVAAGKPGVYKWQVEEAAQMIEVVRGMYDYFGKATF
jgi:hypothetical protein